MSLAGILATLLLALVLILAVFAAWFGYWVHRQNVRLGIRVAELEQRSTAQGDVPPVAVDSVPESASEAATQASDKSFIVVMPSNLGLMAEFMKVLTSLARYAGEGMIPIVYFNKPSFLYWGDEGWNGARNGWEYYFHPLSEYRLEDVTGIAPRDLETLTRLQVENFSGGNVVVNDRLFHDKFDMFGDVLPEHREHFAALCADYIRVREEVVGKVDGFTEKHFHGSRTVGIHYRATDKLFEIAARFQNNGLDPAVLDRLSIDLYLDEALAVADDDTLFFLATEDENALDQARIRLGERLIFSQATRTRDPLPGFLTEGNPALGEEALVDCLLLSRCDHLVHGVSFLTWAARIFNPALPSSNVLAKLAGVA